MLFRSIIESNFDFEARGDNGAGLGAWQLHKSAWDDACEYAKHKDMSFYSWNHWDSLKGDYKRLAFDPDVSRIIARNYLRLLEERMTKNGIKPTATKLYMAYNMGYSGAAMYDFSHTALGLDKKRRSILARANYILSR